MRHPHAHQPHPRSGIRRGAKAPAGLSHRIASIHVKDLFGLYSYDIPVAGASLVDEPTLLLLYGENGTGKTTLLELVYHLLGKEDNRGHRSFLARTPFRSLKVALNPETIVEARRTGTPLVGGYQLLLRRPGHPDIEAEALADPDLSIRPSSMGTPRQRERWRSFLDGLAALEISFFFLSADRRADQDEGPDRDVIEVLAREDALERAHLRRSAHSSRDRADIHLEQALARLDRWIRDEALKSANVGEAGSHTVYAEIAKRIAQTRKPGRPRKGEAAELIAATRLLASRASPFVQLGFLSPPDLTGILTALEGATAPTRQLIAGVVAPYVDSLKTRLDAMQALQGLVALFLERINGFFHNKSVSYTLTHGLVVAAPDGRVLRPSELSSGEQQLLGLFAQVLVARSAASVFLIDEPEISLNVKWQRALADTLLQLVRGTSVQFILATHSLELLATHRQYVHRLES